MAAVKISEESILCLIFNNERLIVSGFVIIFALCKLKLTIFDDKIDARGRHLITSKH